MLLADEGEAGRCVGTFRAGALKRFGKAAVDFLRSVVKEHSGGDREGARRQAKVLHFT